MNDDLNQSDLDIIGVLAGTDKSSSVTFAWDYLRHYQTLFAPWRDEPINFIEIGVANGSSLDVWRTYFPRAQIVGIDIDPACQRLTGDRVAIEIGSQEDPGFLHQVCAKYPPSIIIDDGSHQAHHMVYSFKRMFPMLRPGGLFVVEDLEFQFGRFGDWGVNKTVSAPDYFLDLARARLAYNTSLDEVWGDDRYIRDHIDTMTLIGGAVAIQKKKPRDVAAALKFAERHSELIDPSPDQLLRLAEFIIRHAGPLDHAERAVRRAIDTGGKTSASLHWQIEVMLRQGRADEAAEATSEAIRLRPDDHGAWLWHSRAEHRRGRVGEAILALQNAASLKPDAAHYHDGLADLARHAGDLKLALSAAKQAAQLNPAHEPWQRRVTDLEGLVAASAGV